MTDDVQNDERLNTSRAEPKNRRSRGKEDRQATEDREVTDEERLEAFRNRLFQAALPILPEIPGFHVCWLTTTNDKDTIQMREMWGYAPVLPEDVPGWDLTSIKTGEYAGCIGVNEMLAYKISLTLYESYMTEAHHNAPLEEEKKLRAVIDMIEKEAADKGAQLIQGDGTAALGKALGSPIFEGVGE